MTESEPNVKAWADAFRAFSVSLSDFKAGLIAATRGLSDVHDTHGHLTIRDELTACVLGARKRPELEGEFADPAEM